MGLRSARHEHLPFEEGFPDFYEQRSRDLLLFFARRTYDAEVALDLTAETFAQALLSKRKYRGSTDDEAAAWLYGIARHVLSRYFRKSKAERKALARLRVETPAIDADELERIDQLADLASLRSVTANALRDLTAEQRRALELRVVRELPYPEVASQLGITEQSARARVSRGLRALSEHLDRPSLQEDPS